MESDSSTNASVTLTAVTLKQNSLRGSLNDSHGGKIQCSSLIHCMCRFHYVNWLSQPLLALTATMHTCQTEWSEIRIKTTTVHIVQSDLSLPVKVLYYFFYHSRLSVSTFLNVSRASYLPACMGRSACRFNTNLTSHFFFLIL